MEIVIFGSQSQIRRHLYTTLMEIKSAPFDFLCITRPSGRKNNLKIEHVVNENVHVCLSVGVHVYVFFSVDASYFDLEITSTRSQGATIG